eukprot:UN06025
MQEIAKIAGQNTPIRVTVFTTPALMDIAMQNAFGQDNQHLWKKDQNDDTCKKMVFILKSNLLHDLRWSFNSKIGLLQLYEMAKLDETHHLIKLPQELI